MTEVAHLGQVQSGGGSVAHRSDVSKHVRVQLFDGVSGAFDAFNCRGAFDDTAVRHERDEIDPAADPVEPRFRHSHEVDGDPFRLLHTRNGEVRNHRGKVADHAGFPATNYVQAVTRVTDPVPGILEHASVLSRNREAAQELQVRNFVCGVPGTQDFFDGLPDRFDGDRRTLDRHTVFKGVEDSFLEVPASRIGENCAPARSTEIGEFSLVELVAARLRDLLVRTEYDALIGEDADAERHKEPYILAPV